MRRLPRSAVRSYVGALCAVVATLLAPVAAHAAMASDTTVATPSGAKLIGDVTVGDQLLGWSTPGTWAPATVAFASGTTQATAVYAMYLVVGDQWIIVTRDQPLLRADNSVARAAQIIPGDSLATRDGAAAVKLVSIGRFSKRLTAVALGAIRPSSTPSGHVFEAAGLLLGDYALEIGLPQTPAQTVAPTIAGAARAAGSTAAADRVAPLHPAALHQLTTRGQCIEAAMARFSRGTAGEGDRAVAAVRTGCRRIAHLHLVDTTRVAPGRRTAFRLECPARSELSRASIAHHTGRLSRTTWERIDERTVRIAVTGGAHASKVTATAHCRSLES